MIWLLAALMLALAFLLRLGASSLLSTAHADAVKASVRGIQGAARAAALLERREVTVQAVAVVHSTLLVVATLGAVWAASAADEGLLRGVILAALAMLVIMTGDMIPRVLGRSKPGRIGFFLVSLVYSAVRIGSMITEVASLDEPDEAEDPHEERQERQMISSVIEFSDTMVREVMVPRTEMVVVRSDDTFETLLSLVNEHGFSRIPVIGTGIDDVIGIAIIKDLLKRNGEGRESDRVGDLMRSALFVPDTKKVSDLLREMQASKMHMVVVIDEYGSTAGVVTIEDLLEELVGEIIDEYDREEPLLTRMDNSTWMADGRVDIAELSDAIGIDLPEEDWDTVAGLILGLAGRVPKEGERFEFSDVEFTVTRVQGRRVAAVKVGRLASSSHREET